MTMAWGVTPQAQKTGMSALCRTGGSPQSGVPRSVMPIRLGSPTCTGAPCTAGYRAQIRTASDTRLAGIPRMETTIEEEKTPARSQAIVVRYIGTVFPAD